MSRPGNALEGRHLIADLYDCTRLDEAEHVERALADAASASGATLLEIRLHSFGEGQGVTGVALLAESHISIHTWPERAYAAVDIFLCAPWHDLEAALAALRAAFSARQIDKKLIPRGGAAGAAGMA